MSPVCDGNHARRLSLSTLLKRPADFGGMPVVPGALDRNASRVAVAGLGDPAALRVTTTRTLAWNQSIGSSGCVFGQLPSMAVMVSPSGAPAAGLRCSARMDRCPALEYQESCRMALAFVHGGRGFTGTFDEQVFVS